MKLAADRIGELSRTFTGPIVTPEMAARFMAIGAREALGAVLEGALERRITSFPQWLEFVDEQSKALDALTEGK